MKVREVLDLLSYGTRWQLIGAMTGKKLCSSMFSSEKRKEEFMDLEAVHLFPSFYVNNDCITRTPEFMTPMICIWVSGK